MRQSAPSTARAIALACAMLLCGGAAQAQDTVRGDATVARAVVQKQASEIANGDPVRWHRDDASREAAMQTLKKDIGAAYDEAKRACAKGAPASRGACLQAARNTWRKDLDNAPAQLDAARDMGSVTTVTTTITPAATPASAAATPH